MSLSSVKNKCDFHTFTQWRLNTFDCHEDSFQCDQVKKGSDLQLMAVHSKNWSVVSTLITAQKQCLGKCHFNT
jgi:hypothetical protein